MFISILVALLRSAGFKVNDQNGEMELKLVPPFKESQADLTAIIQDIRDMCGLVPLYFFGLSSISDDTSLLLAQHSITNWASESHKQLGKNTPKEYWFGLIIIEDLLRSYAESYNQPNRDEVLADMVERFDDCHSIQDVIDVSTPFVVARLSNVGNASYLKPSENGGESAGIFMLALQEIAASNDDVVANIKRYYEAVSLNKWLLLSE